MKISEAKLTDITSNLETSCRDFNKRNSDIAKMASVTRSYVYIFFSFTFQILARYIFLLLQFLHFRAKDYKDRSYRFTREVVVIYIAGSTKTSPSIRSS